MSTPDRVVELLMRWEESVEAGRELTASELCPDDPALCDLLAERIQRHRAFQKKWGRGATAAGSGASAKPAEAAALLAVLRVHCGPPQQPGELGRLGSFRLLQLIGFGGMGAVFAAEEPQLGRHVALKVLRPHLAAAPLARQRFLREAQAVAALAHDHVVTIHHVGQEGILPYFTMPLLQGEMLETRLQRTGALTPQEAIRIAAEVADGLAAAHAHGLIHRDIKPGNLWLEGDQARVKILDFGLVKTGAADRSSPTVTVGGPPDPRLTDPDDIPGTLAYMSPEQLQGLPVDARSDLFSLGAVLYEMVTGRKPFTGSNPPELKHAILFQTPPAPRTLRRSLGTGLEKVIQKALQKKPAERQASAIAFRNELLAALPRSADRRWVALGGAAAVLVFLTTLLWRPQPPTPSDPQLEAVPFTNALGRELSPCFSPDGEEIAFVWTGDKKENNVDIYVKGIREAEPRRLTTHPAMEVSPVWSPTGDRIAFSRFMGKKPSQIAIIPKQGGEEKVIWEGQWVQHLDWSPAGELLALSHETNVNGSPILLLNLDTRKTQQITFPPLGASDSAPKFSPDGKALAFIRKAGLNSEHRQLCVVSLANPEEVRVVLKQRGVFRGVDWIPDGRELVYSYSRTGRNRLWRIAVQGGPAREIRLRLEATSFFPAVARKGRRLAFMVFYDDWTLGRLSLAPAGPIPPRLEDFLATTRADDAPAYSADGKRVVFTSDRTEKPELWVYDFDRKKKSQLTRFDGPEVGSPRWSPDGRHIVFDSNMEKKVWIYVVDTEAAQGHFRKVTMDGVPNAFLPCWTTDGRWLFFTSRNVQDQEYLWKVPATGGQAQQMTFTSSARPLISPEGQWVYFNGKDNTIFKIPIHGGEPTAVLQLPNTGDMWNAWEVGKQGIYYLDFQHGRIQVHPFGAKEPRTVGTFRPERPYVHFGRFPGARIAVAPNEKELMVVQFTRDGSNIYLVEDFR